MALRSGLITTIGEILVEILATERGEGFAEAQPLLGPFPSGAPAIFIDQVGKLGHPAAIVSAVGDDDFGRLNLRRLARDGVDVSAVSVHSDRIATGSAFVRYRHDGSRDFVYDIRHSANSRIGPSQDVERILEATAHLHVMGSSLSLLSAAALIRKAMAEVKGHGGAVSFDPNIRKELMGDARVLDDIEAVVATTDILLPSGDELLTLTGAADESDAIRTVQEWGVGEIVLKRGPAGASYFGEGGPVHVPSFEVAEVDPTGAGDCFGAAYIVCRRNGMPVAEALRYANAAGARTVTVKGPMEGASSFDDLDAFLRSARLVAG
jgi:sugar/nucleoside kinase (ribokinase family)